MKKITMSVSSYEVFGCAPYTFRKFIYIMLHTFVHEKLFLIELKNAQYQKKIIHKLVALFPIYVLSIYML